MCNCQHRDCLLFRVLRRVGLTNLSPVNSLVNLNAQTPSSFTSLLTSIYTTSCQGSPLSSMTSATVWEPSSCARMSRRSLWSSLESPTTLAPGTNYFTHTTSRRQQSGAGPRKGGRQGPDVDEEREGGRRGCMAWTGKGNNSGDEQTSGIGQRAHRIRKTRQRESGRSVFDLPTYLPTYPSPTPTKQLLEQHTPGPHAQLCAVSGGKTQQRAIEQKHNTNPQTMASH